LELFNRLIKLWTKNYNEVPLLWVDFNLYKYKSEGAKNSCVVKLHPDLKNDEYIKSELGKVIDYIRDNYDMEKITKI
jgi:hypothetical protein